ncbi:MAG: PorT family protein [Fibromonadales bacterium]|nr:PorT family protein [Fibromonadales bacterium]
MKKVLIPLFIFSTFAFSAINLAVIDMETDSSAHNELTESEQRYITQEIRRQARNNLPDNYNVMTEQAVMVLGDAVLQECAEENCMVSFGEKIGADYITKGTVSKFRSMYVLTIELYETKKGMMVVSSDPIESTDLDKFIPEIRNVSPALFKKFIDMIEKKQAEEEKKGKLQGREQKLREDLEKITIGIRAGFNLYKYFDDNDDDYDLGKGFGGGLTVRIPITSRLFINPGLDAYYRELFSWEKGDGSLSEFVISIPILLQFMPIEGGSFFLSAGPQVDIPIISDLKYLDKTYDIGRSKFDINAVFGLGYIIIPGLVVDIKAVMDITPVFDKFGLFMQPGFGLAYFF